MNTRNWSETLRLLCMMILADGKVYQEEVEAFKKSALALRDIVNPNLMLTNQMVEDWFVIHRDEIEIGVSKIFFESSVKETLQNLNEVVNKEELITALLKVAISDGHRHYAETKLLKLACETWGLDIILAS